MCSHNILNTWSLSSSSLAEETSVSVVHGVSTSFRDAGNANGDFSQGTFDLGGEGVTTNDASIERIEIYATGRLIGLNVSDWKTNHHHSCAKLRCRVSADIPEYTRFKTPVEVNFD